jgi:hypothetical protein
LGLGTPPLKKREKKLFLCYRRRWTTGTTFWWTIVRDSFELFDSRRKFMWMPGAWWTLLHLPYMLHSVFTLILCWPLQFFVTFAAQFLLCVICLFCIARKSVIFLCEPLFPFVYVFFFWSVFTLTFELGYIFLFLKYCDLLKSIYMPLLDGLTLSVCLLIA